MCRTIISDVLIAAFMLATVVGATHTKAEIHTSVMHAGTQDSLPCWTEPSADNERICGNPKLAPQNATDWGYGS